MAAEYCERPSESDEQRSTELGFDDNKVVGKSTRDMMQAGLFVKGTICDKCIKFLVDTGSTHTVISKSTYLKLDAELRPTLKPLQSGIKQADGNPLEVLGSGWIDLRIGKTNLD